MTPFEHTIDWNDYWTGTGEGYDPPSAELLHEPLLAFLTEVGPPASYADVGCGPGATVFAVADRFPEVTVVGYDAAESVLETDRARAAERGLDARFERTVLPAFDPDRQFEVVSAFYTLCYVADVEAALAALYDAVEPGGYLLFTYSNRYTRAAFERISADPEAALDEDSRWDPDTFAERFELVLGGENLLSYDRIHEILGAWPQSLWSRVDAERYAAWRQHPVVFVPR